MEEEFNKDELVQPLHTAQQTTYRFNKLSITYAGKGEPQNFSGVGTPKTFLGVVKYHCSLLTSIT